MKALLLTLTLAGLVALAARAAPATADPMPGDRFPSALAAPDQNGKPQLLATVMGTRGVAVLFVRSADWCPFCRGQLVDANRHLPKFLAQGVSVVAVSVDEVPLIAAFAGQQHIGYTLLSDPKGAINLALGIRDEQYPLGTQAYGVPRPTIYVIDRQGLVRLRYQEPTFRTRPNLDRVLADIARLALP